MRAHRWAAAAVALALVAASCGGDDGETPDTEPARVRRVVALGDSFMAGGGAPPYDQTGGTCFRSTRSWPRLLAEDVEGVQLVDDRSCGGATIDELLGPWPEKRQPAQIPAEAGADEVDIVLLSIGGNDVGLGAVLLGCFEGECAGSASTPAQRTTRAALTERLVAEVYPALAEAYPGARILHVDYPPVLPSATVAPVGCPWLSPPDQDAALTAVTELDAAITSAVSRARGAGLPVELVDTQAALTGHELCTAEPWVNPLGTAEALHPTGSGYAAIARLVAPEVRG